VKYAWTRRLAMTIWLLRHWYGDRKRARPVVAVLMSRKHAQT